MTAALKQVASVSDTHPSLEERIHALGGTAELAAPAPGQAADLLLRPALSRLLAAFDQQWHEQLVRWRESRRPKHRAQQEVFAPAPPR